MTLYLPFKDCASDHPVEPNLKVHQDDLDKATSIGILTLYELSDSDYTDFPELCQEIDFLNLQEQHDDEEMFDDLDQVIINEIEQLYYPYFEDWYACLDKPDPLRAKGDKVIVRVVMDKGHYYLGSIAGQKTNVYISRDITNWDLDIHSYYQMDLKLTTEQRNMWTAEKIYTKTDTNSLLIGESTCFRDIPNSHPYCVQQCYTFDLPTPSYYIGAMIGKEGRNINNLISRISSNLDQKQNRDPEFTIYPHNNLTRVDVYIPDGCNWGYENVYDAISYLHY
tara:strand:- start:1501 stop:2340 length:840 start_codon:yes stop_codon:yes gene_type:complete